MDDKCLMENLLLVEKGVCDLYMHGTIESGTANVRSAFNKALGDSLCMQDDIYKKMTAKGWYPTEQAEQQKIQQVKQKFAAQQSTDQKADGIPVCFLIYSICSREICAVRPVLSSSSSSTASIRQGPSAVANRTGNLSFILAMD